MSFLGDAASDAAFQAYTEEVNRIRVSLMGDPQTSVNSEANVETMKYYLEVKALGTLAGGVEVISSDRLKSKTDAYYAPGGAVDKQTKTATDIANAAKTKSDKDTKDYYDNLQAFATDNFYTGVANMQSPTPPETSPTQFTPANPEQKIVPPDNVQKIIDKQAQAESNAKDFFATHNVNAEFPRTGAFNNIIPEPGEAVLGHDGVYGQTLSNSEKFVVGDGNGGTQTIFKSWMGRDGKADKSTTGTPDAPFTDKINAMLEEQRKLTPGSYRFFIEKLHGKSISGDFYKKGPIKAGMTRDQLSNRMVFPAYITTFNDNYAASWSDYKFIGRGEKVYMYEETTRSMVLEFYMMADWSADLMLKAIKDYQALTTHANPSASGKLDATQGGLGNTQHLKPGNLFDAGGKSFNPNAQPLDETEILKELQRLQLDWGDGTSPNSSFTRGNRTGFVQGQYSGTPEQLWARYTFLAQCMYAWYRKDGKMKEQPFVRIRIGDFFDVIAKVDSLDFTQDEFDVDLNPSVVGAIPMGVKVAMRLTIVHEDEPNSEYAHFYHRRDFDGLNVSPQALPDNMQETSKTLDSTLDKNQTKSPISSLSSLSNHGLSQNAFPNDVKAVQEALKSFGGSIGNLQSSANSVDFAKIAKIKEALLNAKRLLDIARQVDAGKIKSVEKEFSTTLGGASAQINPTSLANTPILSQFPAAKIAKVADVPLPGKDLFPKFKNPLNPPPTT
jgi:hypothetical protein